MICCPLKQENEPVDTSSIGGINMVAGKKWHDAR